MKGKFLILILLITSMQRLEEACKTQNSVVAPVEGSKTSNGRKPQIPTPPAGAKHETTNEKAESSHDSSPHSSPIKTHDLNNLPDYEVISPQPHQKNSQSVENANNGLQNNLKARVENGKAQYDYDLIIVGAGAQMVAVVVQLSKCNIQPPFRILIVEKKSVSAVGLPYDANVAKPAHLLNIFAAVTVDITGGDGDFSRWAKYNLDGEEQAKLRPEVTLKTPPKRITIGQYLTFRFNQYVRECRNKQYTVDSMNSTEAENIQAHDAGNGYHIKLAKKHVHNRYITDQKVHVRDVYLATGHWYRSRFKNPPKGYFESPWPADLLLAEIKPVHIGILGGGLSGIDTVLTLAHEFGEFDENLDFTTVHKDFEITMYSRSGYLPGIKTARDASFTIHQSNHITLKNIAQKMINDRSLGAFDALFKLLKQDLADALPASIGKLENLDAMEPEKFFGHLDKVLYPDPNPEKAFFLDMEGKASPDRHSLIKLFTTAEKHFQLSRIVCKAEDYIKFKAHIAPRVVKIAIEIPQTNAKKLHSLMKKGHLHIQAIGESYKVGNKTDGQGVTLKYRHRQTDQPEEIEVEVEVDHDYFVDAAGQSSHIAKDPSKLIQSLLKNKLATPMRFPYKNQDYAEMVYLDGESKDKNRNRIVDLDGTYYLDADGVLVNMTYCFIKPAEGVSNVGSIYASGPLILGYMVPVQWGLPSVVEIAKDAVGHMELTRSRLVDAAA